MAPYFLPKPVSTPPVRTIKFIPGRTIQRPKGAIPILHTNERTEHAQGRVCILSRKGSIGRGTFKEIPWHKQERENIMRAVGVKVEYGEAVFKGEDKGIYKTVGDREHADIIKLYVNDELGMHKMAEKIGRSTASVQSHIKKHDRAVRRSGFCPSCRRVKAPYESDLAAR